mgnify:CR=1 FL=1
MIVLELDGENRRLSLGHKQLQENPWDTYETIFIEDSVHEGEVVSIFEKSDSSNRIVRMKLFSDLSTINQLFVLLNEDVK